MMAEKKPYLADVPVRVNIWIRPEAQRRQFEVLKQARPSVMFLISDGGRNQKEWDAILENRKLFEEEVDWDCTIYRIFEDKNNGLYTMAKKGADLIWRTVDRCIFLEDDQLPSVSFFQYAAELLEKYKDDTRISTICSMNHTGVWENANVDYMFSETGAIWGTATWKRVFEQRKNCFDYKDDPYAFDLLKESAKKDKFLQDQIIGYTKNEKYRGHIAGGEFYNSFNVYGNHQLFIVPKYNMMNNVGCTSDSAHATEYRLMPKAIRKIFNMKTYEYEFPLKHPKYVVADTKYAKAVYRIMAYNRPISAFGRRIESAFLSLRYKGVAGLFRKFQKAKNNKGRMEK